MKKFMFGILLAVLSNFAQAGYLVDGWKTGAPEEVCRWAADQVGYAIDRRLVDVPLTFKDKNELPADYNPNRIPRDALYISDWNNLDEADKEFFTKFVELGYTLAERKLKENPAAKFPNDFGSDYDKFMSACMTKKNEAEEIFRLIHTGSAKPQTQEELSRSIMGTASSESIRGEPIGLEKTGVNEKLFLCQELGYDINLIARSISEGEPLENMVALANRSPELRQDRLERILRMLPEAYAHQGPIIDWMKEEYKECMQ